LVCVFIWAINTALPPFPKGLKMAKKPNYGYEKRQKEIAKKAKKEEKKKRKLEEAEQGTPEAE